MTIAADLGRKATKQTKLNQGSYASGKCQGSLDFFKVRELSGNFMLCQGKMNAFSNVREMSGNFKIFSFKQKVTWAVFLTFWV